jgi:lipooligosaccharide transport system permease protein
VILLVAGPGHQPARCCCWPLLGLVGIVFASVALIFWQRARQGPMITYYFTLFSANHALSGVFFA